MTPKTFYRFQYSDGTLSMVVHDERRLIYDCAQMLSANKKKYPVAVFIVKPKTIQPMTYFTLPDHVCPITGMKLYGKGAGTEQEKKKKRERYHKQKKQGKVVTMFFENSMSVATEGYIK